ncbi:MAG: hypothetical protein AAFV53_34895 [Myxococcota bacterium]
MVGASAPFTVVCWGLVLAGWWWARHPPASVSRGWPTIPLLLAITAAAVTLSAGHLADGVVDTMDFEDYCAGTASFRHLDVPMWPQRRARLAGAPAGLLVNWLGVVDALSLSAIMGALMAFAGVALMGAAVMGPEAGGAAAVIALAMAPIAVLPRTLTWYPVMVGGLTLASGIVAQAAVHDRSRVWFLAGLSAAAACPLLDLRGILWGGALFMVLIGASLQNPRRKQRLGLVAVSAVASWLAGPLSYPVDAMPLEQQVWQAVHLDSYAAQQVGGSSRLPDFPTATVWGRSPPQQLPQGLRIAASISREGYEQSDRYTLSAAQVAAWWAPLLFGVGMTGWRLRRRGKRLMILIAVSAPALMSWIDAVSYGRNELRFLALGAPGVAGWIGVGIVASTGASGGRRAWGVILALAVMVLPGAPLGADAPWRTPTLTRQQHHLNTKLMMARNRRPPRAGLGNYCVRALIDDLDAGRGNGRIYGDLLAPPGVSGPPQGSSPGPHPPGSP